MTNTLENGAGVRGAGAPAALASVVGQAHVTPSPMNQGELWAEHYAEVYHEDPVAGRIWASAGIDTRHGAVNPAHEDISLWSTGQRMERYLQEAIPLGVRAVRAALADSGIEADEVGLFAVVSCTGYATPGLDIRISHALGMSPNVQRLVVGHMGCYAAIPGLAAVSDYVAARGKPAVMLCLELTSLHPQPVTPRPLGSPATEDDIEQMVAHAIFADAASAIVVAPTACSVTKPHYLLNGAAARSLRGHSRLEVVDVAAKTDWSTQDLMRWNVTDFGFRMRLSSKVPAVLAEHVRGVVDDLLAAHGFTVPDVAAWVVHPGGRKILEVVQDRLELPPGSLDASYSVLRDYGNCSSPTVLLVLERILATTPIPSGAPVVMMAFGPGLTLYTALLMAP